MFKTPIAQIGLLALVAVCGLAFWKGGRAERLGAGVYILNWVGAAALQNRADLVHAQYGVFVVDILGAVALATLAVYSRRVWAMWAAAFALLGVLNHIAVIIDLRVMVRAYVTASYLWGFLALAALAVGSTTAKALPGVEPRGRRPT